MILFIAAVVIVIALLPVLELWAEKRDNKRYPPPGDIKTNRQLHVLLRGVGHPLVVLESGLAATSISWLHVQQPIAEFTRVAAYDRAGLGWSHRLTEELTLDSLLSDLSAVIESVDVSHPVILVGHSFGGLIVSAFANKYPERVAALVLVDPVSLETYSQPDPIHLKRLALGIKLSKRGTLLARFAVVRFALSLVARGQRKLPLLIGRVSGGSGNSFMSRIASEIAKLPPAAHNPIRACWSRPASFQVLAKYLELLPAAARQAQAMPIPRSIPVIILSASSATASELAEREYWTSFHSASSHVQVPDTTHWLQLDRPDLIVDAVRRLIIK